jgi:hypothetical protein
MIPTPLSSLYLYDDTSQFIHPLAVDGFACSYLRFSAYDGDKNTTVRYAVSQSHCET